MAQDKRVKPKGKHATGNVASRGAWQNKETGKEESAEASSPFGVESPTRAWSNPHWTPEQTGSFKPLSKNATEKPVAETQLMPGATTSSAAPAIPAADDASQGASAGAFVASYVSEAARSNGTDAAMMATAPTNPEAQAAKRMRRRKIRRGFAIAGASLVAVVAVIYALGCFYFSNHYLPNSTLGTLDVSLSTPDQVAETLKTASEGYELVVKGENGFRFTLTDEDAGITIDAQKIAQRALVSIPVWQWPYQIFQSHYLGDSVEANYDEAGLGEIVRAKVDEYNKTAAPPVNATIGYDERSDGFKVINEQLGTAYNADAVIQAVGKAAFALEDELRLTDQDLQQPTLRATDERLEMAAEKANSFLGADIDLTLAGKPVTSLDSSVISSWVTLDDQVNPTLNQDMLVQWTDNVATDCDTVGSTRSYTRPDGVVVTVSGGDYGWEVDHDALIATVRDQVTAGNVGAVEIPCTSTAQLYNGVGKVDWANRYVDIDLSAQQATFYDNGEVIWSAPVITGKPDGEHDTPEGVWAITTKASPQKLVGAILAATGQPEYISWVDYWMPFVDNVIGMHDATWQPGFGGSMYANGYGSHGCVNLSYANAQALYGIINVGDVVITHY